MPIRTDPLPAFAGIITFLRAPQGDLEDLKEGMVAVAGVTYDLSGTGRSGARFGPRSIREASLFQGSQLQVGPRVDPNTHVRVEVSPGHLAGRMIDLGDLNVYPLDWPRTEAALRRSMYEIVRKGAVPIILGGDHFITCPLLLGYRDAAAERGNGKIGYIQFSSQLDLGDEDPLWGRAWRGATARRILESGAVDRRNMVWIGTNGYLPRDQAAMAQELDLNVFTWARIQKEGTEQVIRQALELAGDGCDTIYVSIDFDVLDGVYVQSISTPTFRGLKNLEVQQAVDILASSGVGALDIVGCNPTADYGSQGGHGGTAAMWGAWMGYRFMIPHLASTR